MEHTHSDLRSRAPWAFQNRKCHTDFTPAFTGQPFSGHQSRAGDKDVRRRLLQGKRGKDSNKEPGFRGSPRLAPCQVSGKAS